MKTTISFSAWCRDCFGMYSNGKDFKEHVSNDYVPSGLGIGGGDEFCIDVDLETGKIIGWDAERMMEYING